MTTGYLTIDDAPTADLPAKLAGLDEFGVPAVLFCEGRRLAEYPEQARYAVEAGFHLGNHTYSHRRSSELSVDEFRDELSRTESHLEDVYDHTTVARPARMFRFPYGDRGGDHHEQYQQLLNDWEFIPPDPALITYEWYEERHAEGYDWFWTLAVEDWNVASKAQLREQVESISDQLEQNSPDIVLFHDHPHTPELFHYFVALLSDYGVEFADPLELLK